MSTIQTSQPASTVKLAVFWLYVVIPLAWGVVNTLLQAVKLTRVGWAQHSAFGIRHSAFGIRHSAFGIRHSAFGVRRTGLR
jgi:hypothetical protein